jgi:hypothetical protein
LTLVHSSKKERYWWGRGKAMTAAGALVVVRAKVSLTQRTNRTT